MQKYLLFILFFCMHGIARGQTGYEYRYWFDNDDANIQTGHSVSNHWQFMADLYGLSESFHAIHIQVADNNGKMSVPLTRYFLKTYNTNAQNIYYWFDNDTDSKHIGAGTQGVFDIDVSSLSEGFHKLFLQIGGSVPSSAICHSFVKIPQTDGVEYLNCLCFIDNNLYRQEQIPSSGGIINWNFDVSNIVQGFHRMQVQVVTPSGAATNTYDAFFLRTTMTEEINDMKCVYCVDGAEFYTETGRMTNGAFHCDIDVSSLSDGPHRLSYYLTNGKGVSTKMTTQFFLKVPVGGNGIIQCEYWLNQNYEARHILTLPERQNPYNLISLLPVEIQSIRSNCFHFEMQDGKPMMYANNDFFLRFFDSSGRFTDAVRQFVDYDVSREINPVGELQSTQTFNKVASNDVRWYTMQVAPGDTAAFKLSQPATVQVFAPSGEEVFKTSESASVKWSGIHTWENGTYYLAVHDVTGTQSTMKLDYMHMDKYDVVDWDVHRVGNGGCSTITFKGNGFRDLYAVDLYNSQGDSIKSVAVGFIDDANVPVTFNFTDAPLGNYDAVFHFTTEDKVFNNIVTVEEAQDIELALDLRYPSSFLRGTSTTYTITVTNKGNSTAYNVPMEIYLSSANSFTDITSVKFKDERGKEFNNFTLDMIEERDSIDDETLAYIDELIQELDGLHTFIVKNDSTGEGEYGFTDQLITIAPNSSSTFYVEIKSSSTVNLKVRIPSEWITIHTECEVAQSRRKGKASESNLCCEKEKWECTANIVANLVGLFPVAGCVSALADAAFFTTFEIACADGNTLGEKEMEFYRSIANNSKKQESVIDRSINGILSCIAGAAGKIINKLRKELKALQEARKVAMANSQHYYQKYLETKELYDYYIRTGNSELAEQASATCKSYFYDYVKYDDEANSLLNRIKNLENQISVEKLKVKDLRDIIKDGIMTIVTNSECVQAWKKAKTNCPPNPKEDDGPSTPQPPADPNDIFGPLSEAGSKFIVDSLARVNYTIEFENDTTFATAAAHTIIIKDTLDKKIFDLTRFMPTGIRIGSREAFLDAADVVTKNNVTSFVKTIDMRPEINAIAQVDGTFNQKNGIAQWTLQSLDPMTMEPTDDLMQGILPVNYNGTSGIGEVMFEVGVKQGKADGTQIKNRAGIVFDYEEAILTPTWTNIVDAVAPSSFIDEVVNENDSTISFHFFGEDNASGIWKYRFYVQAGQNAPWWEIATDIAPDSAFCYRFYDDIDYGFCVLAVDSAGNVEKKVLLRECNFKAHEGDYEVNVDELPASSTGSVGDSRIYDLSGRRHDEPQEGINIIDNKKVLFRRKN